MLSTTCLTTMWIVVAIFTLATTPVHVESVITNGTSGDPCPDRRCLAGEADCINGRCICRHPETLDPDNGNFACYKNYTVFGEVKNDPFVRNFNGEVANFPFSCRYLLANVKTTLRIQNTNVGSCRCVLHAWNDKHRGKFYVGGFDYACYINNTDNNEQLGFSMTISGQAKNGHYMYTEYGNDEFLPDGPWTTTPVHVIGQNLIIKSSYDPVNNQAKVIILECGWKVTFVAYDIQKRLSQEQVPGLSFAVNYDLNPVFYEHDRVSATAPVSFGGTRYRDLAVPPLSVSDALLIRGFTSGVVQNKPEIGESSRCDNVSSILKLCYPDDKIRAALGCFWMLKQPRFIRCMDTEDKVDRLFDLLEKCISYYCKGAVTCELFVNRVTSTGCSSVDRIPELERIVNGSFC